MAEITLLAMAPGGDVLVVRDRTGRVWVHPPKGAGDPRVLDPNVADRAIARHDFERVDREFDTWEDLDAFVEARVAQLPPVPAVAPEALDGEDVLELLDVAQRWAAEGEGVRARRLAATLWAVPAVHESAELRDKLVSFLRTLDEQRPAVRTRPPTERHRQARERLRQADAWEQPAAA